MCVHRFTHVISLATVQTDAAPSITGRLPTLSDSALREGISNCIDGKVFSTPPPRDGADDW